MNFDTQKARNEIHRALDAVIMFTFTADEYAEQLDRLVALVQGYYKEGFKEGFEAAQDSVAGE